MSLEDFKAFMKLNRNFDMHLIPFSHGEALLNPEFNEICEHALTYSNVIIKGIHTNFAMKLTDKHFETLCKHKSIVVNFGGGTTYTHYRNMKTQFSQVLYNLIQLIEVKKRTGSDLMIHPKMVVNKRNKNEIDILRKKLNHLDGLEELQILPVYFSCADSDAGDIWRFYNENLEEGLPCRGDWMIDNRGIIQVPQATVDCPLSSRVLTIRWNGGVHICCRARYHEGFIANAFEEPIREILKSDRYKEAIEKAKRREYVDYCKYCF